MTNLTRRVDAFFEDYQDALLARDAKAIAHMYSIPSLIVFPGNLVVVTDSQQTEEFFESAWEQYDNVLEVARQATIMANAPGSVWVDVTWSYHGRPQERFCYQLVEHDNGYQIGVLTPLE